ncbi:MAG: M20 family metallopeptidase [Thermomicrobiales bacterium]
MNHWAEKVDRDGVIAIAKDLIAIPSVSGEERAVMDFVAGWCAKRMIDYQVLAKDPERPNVVISIGDPSAGPTIVMNGHLDTVPVSDAAAWESGPFEPRLSEDSKRLFGRGSGDMKASTGVMIYLMGLLKDAPLKGCLQAHVVSDEELSGNFGTIFLLDEIKAGRLAKPDYCLIGEKSDLKVRNAERGILGMEVTFLGRASHTSAARATGINAIAKAAKGVLALEQEIDRFHPAVGYPVISINTIEAGVAHNVVPGECKITIDRRLVPGETKESVVAEVRSALDAVANDDPDFKYELTVDPDGDFIEANITPEDAPLVAALQESVRTVMNKEPEFFVAWAGATDGRFYRQAGIDTAGFGPSGERAHGANECVYIDDLITEARVYAETITRLLSAA